MTFDNIKLEKGLYSSAKGFTASLEEIDPSENYTGTSLEGLDAYQRQLKRFDIKVSGSGSDSVSKFFQTSDSAALFPEYASRAVQQGMEEADLLNKIIATTTNIDSLDYRVIESIPGRENKELADVAEGAYIPETRIKTKEKLTRLYKRGRMLVASYEAVKFQKLDLFTVTLKQIGAYIARSQFKDAVEALTSDDIKTLDSTETELKYSHLIDVWNALEPYNMTSIIANSEFTAQLLQISEFKDSNAGQNFHGSGKMITPLGAEVIRYSGFDLNGVLALDKSAALEKVQAGNVATEYDKLIDRQLERAAITATAGFSKIFSDASVIQKITV
ncbi:MAG: phage major capsid protein [Clostridiales bacterium]|nr:phage major capsid protein [Clostridiales bacterium]